jgi:hypothetical protein
VSTTVIVQEVAHALVELHEAFPGRLASEPDGLGGALVSIADTRLPAGWPATHSALMFVIPFNFPAIPVYPYYIAAEVAPAGALGDALQRVQWRDRSVLQLSLRHNRWRPGLDTVFGSVLQAMDWLAQR